MRRQLTGGLCFSFVLTMLTADGRAAQPKTAPPSDRIAAIAAVLPESPQGVGRPIGDRQAWAAAARAPGAKSIVTEAERIAREPVPELPDDLYLEFSKNGNRSRYERVMFQRRARFPTLVLAECLENRGRFLGAIDREIRAVLAEKAWTLPAHDAALGNFKGTAIDIDLASSAMGWNLATAAYWLGDKLPKETRDLLVKELEHRIFRPFEGYLNQGRPRMRWPTCTSNWNAVCLAGVTGTATAAIEDRQRRALYVAAAEKLIRHFYEGFTDDGYCSEGLGYWNYGFGHFLLLAETIHQATGGKIDLLTEPKVKQVAQFGRRLEILPGIYPAFADCHIGSRPDARIEAFVSRRYGFGWGEAEQRGLLLQPGLSRSLFETGIHCFANSASTRPTALSGPASAGLRDWFADAGILVCRPATSGGLGAALKGGHNAEHHNHNDVGSFVVALGRATPLVDPGSEVYTQRTFSARRYDSNVLNSFGHPVPRVAGQLQRPGRDAAARVVKTEFTDRRDTLVLDIASAYAVKDLKKLHRTFVFSREGGGSLTVTDEAEFARPQQFGTALITFFKWRADGPEALMVGDGADTVQVAISTGGAKFRIEPEEIKEDLPGGRTPTRLGIELAEPAARAEVGITIRIAGRQ